MSEQVSFVCPESLRFEEVQEKLVGVSGVSAVARVPSKDKSIRAYVVCTTEEAAAGVKSVLTGLEITLEGEKTRKSVKENKKKTPPASKKKPTNRAAEFFNSDTKRSSATKQGSTHGQVGGEQRPNEFGQRGGPRRQGARHTQRNFYRPLPYQWIRGYVAVLDNVPFNTTNEQLASIFADCGPIYDINRLENMAMVYFEQQDSVQQAIVVLNGKRIKENVITVSYGGSVKVPVPL